MRTEAVVRALECELENPKHSHHKWVKRPWWKWTLHWDPEDRLFYFVRQDRVEVPCDAKLETTGEVKTEFERRELHTVVVASRMFRCPNPSVPGESRVIMYAAARLE